MQPRPRPRLAQSLALALLLLGGACVKPPVSDEVTIEFPRERGTVTVTAETTFDLAPADPPAQNRVERMRSAALAGTDPWAVRFARVHPETERETFDRTRGRLERVTRSVRIAPEELQQVFADTTLTVAMLRGERWEELAFYAGSASRASREQEQRFDEELQSLSRSAAVYYRALDDLYRWMESHPYRAPDLFAALLKQQSLDGSDPIVTEEEQPLVAGVGEAMEEIGEMLERRAREGSAFEELADLLYNPFPSRMAIHLPGNVIAHEGFTLHDRDTVILEPVSLLDTVSTLDERWASPDPLAILLLADQPPSAVDLASRPRSSTPTVSAAEIAQTVRQRLVRPRTYVVRWSARIED